MQREAPNECPVCSADIQHRSPETSTDFAEWEYECGAIIQRADNGDLFAYATCPEAMREAISRLNKDVAA